VGENRIRGSIPLGTTIQAIPIL
jgi:hypothetical protein